MEKPNLNRRNTPILLLPEEKELFQNFAEQKGWSTGKFLRIAGRTIILMEEKQLTLENALNTSVLMEVDMRKYNK